MLEIIQFQLLLATFAGWVGRQQSAVIAYLLAGFSSTTIGGLHEGVVRIFGHYGHEEIVRICGHYANTRLPPQP